MKNSQTNLLFLSIFFRAVIRKDMLYGSSRVRKHQWQIRRLKQRMSVWLIAFFCLLIYYHHNILVKTRIKTL